MLLEPCNTCGTYTDQRDRDSGQCPTCLREEAIQHLVERAMHYANEYNFYDLLEAAEYVKVVNDE